MADAAPAARGVYKPRCPQASPLFRLVSDHLHRLQTVYDERFAREYGPWRSVVAQVVDKFLACGVLEMMEGIDSTFSAAIFIGYHSTTTNPQGVRAHTISSATFAAVKLNGQPIAESAINAINAINAGQFGVPVVKISGDEQAVGEMQKLTGNVEGAVVKRSITFHAAAVMIPEASQALIRARAKTAIARLKDFKPIPARGPFQLELTYKSNTPAEMLAYLPGIERVDAHTARFRAPSFIDVTRFLEFSISYRAGLTP